MEPTNKRKRTDLDPSHDGQSTESPKPISWSCSKDIYLHDGNIVLVEDIAFRVHKSVLQRHSEVFRGMLEVACQPEGAQEFDGCPAVRLSDASRDVSELLKYLYDHSKLDHTNIEQLSSVLRLSTKYIMDPIRTSAIEALAISFPDNLPQWDNYGGNRADASRVVKLAHDVNADILLPAAYYSLSGLLATDVFADQNLSRQMLERYSVGKEAMHRHMAFFILEEVKDRGFDLDCASCDWDFLELWVAEEFLRVGSRFEPLADYQRWLQNDSLSETCIECRLPFEDRIRVEREAMWARLPRIFQLGSWATLRKKSE